MIVILSLLFKNPVPIASCAEVDTLAVARLKNELDKCSVFVLPSYHEGMPRSVLEALAVGRPVITTNIPGSIETVVNNHNGFLVEKKNINDLIEKMELFIKNPNLLIKMGSESNKIAINKFDVKNINSQILNFLKN